MRTAMLGAIARRKAGSAIGAWNLADAAAGIVLSSGDKVASKPSSGDTNRGVRGMTARSTGKLQIELSAGVLSSASEYYVGVAEAACSLTAQPIFGSLGGVYAVLRLNTQIGSDLGYAGAPGAAISNAAHVYGVVVDFAARQAAFYVDGVAHSNVTYGTDGGPLYPFLFFGAGNLLSFALNTGASELAHPVAGATAWD